MKLKNLCYIFLLLFSLSNIILPANFALFGIKISADYVVASFLIAYITIIAINSEQREIFIESFKRMFKTTTGILMIVTLTIMLISVVYAREKNMALKETFRLFTNIFLFSAARFHLGDGLRLRNVINAVYGAAALICIYGIIQNFTGIGLGADYVNVATVSANRITSTFHHPNAYGSFLVLLLFPLLMLIFSVKTAKERVIYAAIALLIVINIVFTLSRNAWLAVAFGFVVLALYYSKKLLIPFVVVVLLIAQIPMINNRIKDIADPEQNSSRIKHWKVAFLMIQEHPILGVGNGNYVSYYDDYIKVHPELDFNNESRFPTHNSYLKVISELGVLGSIPFIALLFVLLYRMPGNIRNTNDRFIKAFYIGFFASYSAFLFMNLIDNVLFVPKAAVFFWIFVGMAEATKENQD